MLRNNANVRAWATCGITSRINMAALGASLSSWPFKSIFITGCNRGIGLELVKQILNLSTPPRNIFATCRSIEIASELKNLAASNSNLHLIEFDVTDFQAIGHVVSEVEKNLEGQGLNLVINNAGVMDSAKLNDVTAEGMIDVLNTNVVAPLMLTKGLLPLLRRAASQSNDQGSTKALVANMSSSLGSIANTKGGLYPYRTSKAALNMVTKSLSIDLEKDGIMTVSLHPGWVQTDMGGSNAAVTTEQSVQGLLSVIASLDESKNGGFLSFSGEILPW